MSHHPISPGDHTRTLHIDGRERTCLLHVPTGYDASQPTPLVLALHGATSNAKLMQAFCGLSDKADREGFLVAYPNGTGNTANVLTWNGGACCGYALKHQVDDIAFLAALLDDLAKVVNIDEKRVFVCGMSNGAQMTYRLAAALPQRIAAAAAVAGPLGIEVPPLARPVPLLHIHGTEDRFAPYLGGVGDRSVYGVDFRSAPDSVLAWALANGCSDTAVTQIDEPTVDDGTRIVRSFYGGGEREVVLITVEGGGHTWPGLPPLPALLGLSTSNLDANHTIWQFFESHPLPTR